jgi:uncharacterized protein DUF1565
MKRRSFESCVRAASACAALLLGAERVRAADWYVDAVTGNDANDGQTASTAWRTITHALAALPSQPPLVLETIHVAAGVYDSQLGETYPLTPRLLTRIVGSSSGPGTILDGGGASTILAYWEILTTPVDPQTGADALTLRNAVTAVTVVAAYGAGMSPSFSDLRIRDTTGPGVVVEAAGPHGHSYADFERVDIDSCSQGVSVQASASYFEIATAEVRLAHSNVRGSTAHGISLSATGNGSSYAHLLHTRILGNGGHGISSWIGGGYNTAVVDAASCLIAGNHRCGLFGESLGASGGAFELTDCTVAGNAHAGIRGEYQIAAVLRNSIVAGNGDDLDVLPVFLDALYTASGDADLAGHPRCLVADPRFVDPSSGDFRLRFESPCIDRGDPAAAGREDLLGHVRPYDGDLDTLAAPDMGAFEFEPLHSIGTPRVGRSMHFEMWGSPGSQAHLWFTRLPLVGPSQTPFGTLYLDSSLVVDLGPFALGNPPPRMLDLRVPNDPTLVGSTFSFQSLTSSSAAPQGFALSNPISFVIAP